MTDSTRNDPHPFPVVDMRPTGEGRYAECPDHAGKRLAYRTHALSGSTYFVCPACESTGNAGDPWPVESALFARDIYLEHDESWRVVAGYLYVDTHETPDPDDDRDTVDVCDCCLIMIANGDESGCRDYYGHDHPSCSIGRAVPGDASDTVTRWFRWDCAGCGQTMLPGADAHAVTVFPADD